jgi:hypothetical protein
MRAMLRYPAVHREAELRAMPASRLRELARERNIPVAGLTDKADFARALATTREDLEQLPTGRLRRLLKERGIATWNLLEKSEYVEAFFSGPPPHARAAASTVRSPHEHASATSSPSGAAVAAASPGVTGDGTPCDLGPIDDDDDDGQNSTASSGSDAPCQS